MIRKVQGIGVHEVGAREHAFAFDVPDEGVVLFICGCIAHCGLFFDDILFERYRLQTEERIVLISYAADMQVQDYVDCHHSHAN